MDRPRSTRLAVPGLALLLGLAALAGCDTVNDTPDAIILTREFDETAGGSPIRFGFDANAVTVGETVTLRCGCTIDVEDFLSVNGFAPADLVFAAVQQSGIALRFPVSERLDFLQSAVLRFEAPGLSSTEVASGSSFTSTREADLNPIPNRDVRAFAAKGAFEPVLQIRAGDLQAGARYEIDLSVTLRLEAAGF